MNTEIVIMVLLKSRSWIILLMINLSLRMRNNLRTF